MSQLTFDGVFDGADDTEPMSASIATAEWYKGRSLSYSSMNTYQTCPLRWKFRYIDKIPEKPRSVFSFGKSVHSGLEFLFSKLDEGLPTIEAVLAQFKAGWLRDGYESAAQEKWFFQEGERILRGFYEKHAREFGQVYKVEFRFTFHIEGIPVTGFIDRIDTVDENSLAVIDYKTGKAFDKTRVRRDPQLSLYQMAAKELLGKDVKTVTLYHLNSLTPVTVPAHPKELEDNVRQTVVSTARGISENKFDPNPDAKGHCQWCDYLQICPAFSGKNMVSNSAEPLSSVVDRYGQLDRKAKELAAERDLLGLTLLSHLAKSGATTLDGKRFQIRTTGNAESPSLESLPLEKKEP